MRLVNKTAIVTGGAHGIGRAISEAFAQEGASVWIADIDTGAGTKLVSAIERRGGTATFIECDVSSAKHVRRVIKFAAARTQRVDVLCNNAAFLARWNAVAEAADDEWQKCIAVSLMGSVNFTRAVLPLMLRQKRGSIINISSVQGLVGGRNSAAYASVKHALVGLTRSVACDYGAENIRCNVICPGAIQTRISPKAGSALRVRQVAKTFLGRIGQPREVAAAAVFLGSDESSYITGVVLPVDGGWTAM